MEYYHVILEFEREGKIYICSKFDIEDKNLVDDFAHQYETNEVIIIDGYKINSNTNPCLKIFKSLELFSNYKKANVGQYVTDEGLVRRNDFSQDVTSEFLKTSFDGFKFKAKKVK